MSERFEKLLARRDQREAARRAATGEQHPDQRFSKLKRYTQKASVDLNDLDRICALPIVAPLTDEEAIEVSRRWLLASAFNSGHRLFTPQAWGIQTFEQYLAGFFKIGVGFGKTGLSLMCAEHSYREGLERILLFVPSAVYPQLILRDLRFWRNMISLSVPIHRLGNQPSGMRRRMVDAQRKGLYIMPYSLLSRPDSLHMLRSIDPDVIISDEAHSFKNRRAGRTKKVFGWLDERGAEDRELPKLVAMSGTMASKSIKDYHHLIRWALADGCPLPINVDLAERWGSVLDSGAVIDSEHQTGPLTMLVGWAQDHFPAENFRATVSDFRRAFRLRLSTAPGVVTTSGYDDVDTALILDVAPCDQPGSQITELMLKVKEEHLTPNDDIIEVPALEFKWLSEMTAGFYNELLWPDVERLTSRTWIVSGTPVTFTADSAKAALELGREYHGRQQLYYKELREFLQHAPLGLDTPMEIAKEINQHPDRMPDDLVTLYRNMRDVEHESVERFGTLLEREPYVRRIDDYKIRAALAWQAASVPAGEGCIIWWWHNGVGKWLRDTFTAAGLDVLYAPAGKGSNESLIEPEASRGKVVLASIYAHREGKNMQHFQHQLYVQWPRVALTAEQSLGRTHRNGQEADELVVYRFDVTGFDTLNFAACLNDSVFNHQCGDRRKLVYANYTALPTIMSPEFLREQGADPQILNAEQRQMMEEIFGTDWQDKV